MDKKHQMAKTWHDDFLIKLNCTNQIIIDNNTMKLANRFQKCSLKHCVLYCNLKLNQSSINSEKEQI